MGDAKFNPMSPQYRGKYPEEVNLAAVRTVEHPTPEWEAENRGWRERGEKPPEEHTLVSIMLVAKRVEPSALFPGQTDRWPQSNDVPLGPILFMQPTPTGEYQAVPATMPLADWRKLTPIGATSKEAPVMLEDEVSVNHE